MDLLLCEQVFLLGHDDESGKNEVSLGLSGALAGALLLDLALGGYVTVGEKDKLALSDVTPDHPLLRQATEAIGNEKKPRAAGMWVSLLSSRMDHLDRAVGRSLVERGILGEQPAKVLGLFPTTRWPEIDPAPERELRQRLADVLVRGAEPSEHEIVLVGVLHTYELVNGLVDKDDRKQARRTAKDLAEQAENGDVISRSIGDAVRATQAAVMAAVMTSTVAATVATTTNT